jgi:hypothetical protein
MVGKRQELALHTRHIAGFTQLCSYLTYGDGRSLTRGGVLCPAY